MVAEGGSRRAQPGQDAVEGGRVHVKASRVHVKGQVQADKLVHRHEVEGQLLIHPDRGEVPGAARGRQLLQARD